MARNIVKRRIERIRQTRKKNTYLEAGELEGSSSIDIGRRLG